jgi:hypothetical protein
LQHFLETTLTRRVLTYIFLLFVGIGAASAQTSNGTVVGAITDPTGSGIVGATVTLTSVDTGSVRTTLTNQEGSYRIESVLPGTYNLSASAAGFQTTVNNGLIVPGTAIIPASLVLKVGQASDKIEVSADNAVLNTENGQIDGTIGEMEISSLPIPSLNPYELALTLPGVTSTTQGDFSNGISFNVGGGRPRANNFLIEGQDNNDAGIQGQGLQPGNGEAVKQVVIIENAYTAEYGHGAGSVSNLIYKSGTNEWHGAIYERISNSSTDAEDHQDKFNGVTTKTKYRENLPGFRIGGPIIHNKLFAFGSYQWDIYRSTANLDVLDLPTANGIATLKALPSTPALANLLAAYGSLVGTINPNIVLPNIDLGPDPTTGIDRGTVEMGTVQRSLGANSDSPELDLKGDWIINPKDTMNLRFIRTSFTAPYDTFNFGGQLPGFDSDQDGTSYNAGIVESHVFNPNVVNEFRASYGRIGFSFGIPSSTLANPLWNMPTVSFSGIDLNGYGLPASVIPQGRFHNTYQLQDTISWTHGKHFVKLGTDLADIRVRDEVPFNFYGTIGYGSDTRATTVPVPSGGTTTYTYNALANLVDDFSGGNTSLAQNFGSPIAQPRLFSQNYFVQDTYRPIPTLSVDMGFRYEYNGAPFNATGTPYPAIDVNNIACFPLTPGSDCNTKQEADKGQWGPRLGVAYSPDFLGNGHKTVVRAGFGVFYDVVFTNIIDNIQATAPNAASPVINATTSAARTRGIAGWSEQFANLNQTPLPTNLAEPIVNHLLSPRTMHWNLNVEQELPWDTTFQIGYVGERGTHLYGNTNLNPFVNQYFSADRVNPARGQIVIRDNSGDSEYAGLWSELDHKFNRNFLFRASYTLGRSFDDVSEIFTTNNQSSYQSSTYPTPRGLTDWGPSAYDHRQRLALSYIWTPATWHTEGGMKVIGNIVNHWSVAGVTQFQTGTPENVEFGSDVDGNGISNDRPVVSNPKAPLTTWAFDDSWFYGDSFGTLCSGPSAWWTSNDCEVVSADSVHWVVPPIGTRPSNTVGRNSLYSKGIQQWDMNIQRTFKLHEKVALDFRGELLNAFNHGLGGVENTTLISGIPTDAFTGDNGTNTFADPAPVNYGHRHARFFIRLEF